MKRTFTFLMSLFLCIGMTMKAQPAIDTSTADAPKYYVIASYDRGGVLTNAGVDQALTRADLADAGYWYFEKANDEGGVHIVNKVKDGESKVYVGSELEASTTAAVWYIIPNGVNNAGLSVSKTATVTSSSCIDAHNYDKGVGTWSPSAGDWNGTTWVVSEEKNLVDVVYSYTYGDAAKASETAKVVTAVGYEFPAVTTSFPFGISATKPAGNIAEADAVDGVVTKTIALDENLPFVSAADYASIENWYCLKFHASQQNYLYYDGTENVLDATKTAVDASNRDAYAWAFIGNPFDGFKVVNKLAGADKRINAAQAGAVVGTSDQVFSFTTSSYATNGFFMQATTGDYKERFNKQGGKVVYWSGADGGSTFMVELLPETLTYTLTDAFGNVYTGSYEGVAGQTEPVLSGVVGCTYENAAWDGTAFTANVAFPFPVSNEQTINATMISAHNATNLLWRAEDTGITVQKDVEADSDNYKWAIYPAFAEGSFTFTIKNLGAGKFIYSTSADNNHNAGAVTLAEEGSAFTVEANNRFKLATGKYLSINSATSTDVQILGTWNAHGGTNNKFIPCEYVVVEYADEETINAFFAELAKLDELSYDLEATWEALPAVVGNLITTESVVEQINAGNQVPKADVEAATATVVEANAVAVYYNETYLPTAKAAAELLAALEEGSEAHTAVSAAIAACDLSEVTTVAALEAMEAALAEAVETNTPEADPNDYTSYIKNANLSTTDAWDDAGTKGISGGMVKVGSGSTFDFSQTITLPAGQYKMTAKAAYRYSGSEADEYAAIEAGTPTHLAKLYAETSSYKYEGDVMNRYDGASDTDLAGSGAVVVNEKYVPNSSAAVQAWFDKGQYVNELVFNVQEDGEVKIGIAKTESPAVGDYANIGAWTLTRLGDAEADPQPEPEYPVDVTAQYLTNAGFDDASSWVAEGNVNQSAKEVAGWTMMTTGTDWFYGASVGYGSAATINNAAAPATNPEGVAEGGALGISVGWSCIVEYTQDVVLPAGTYTLTYKAINVNNAATQAANYFGFKSASASYYGKTASYAYNEWEENSVTFVLKEETAGAISVGIGAISGGSGANAKLFIDGVTLSYDPELPVEVPAFFADGDYLIVNTETGCYLGGGNDWGTHATLLKKPQFFTLAHKGDNDYTLDSHQSNGGDSHFLSTGLYCDGAAAYWTFAKKENGNYTISNDGNYLAGNGSGAVIVTVTDATAAAAEWTIISRADAFAALDAATQEAPVDATVYINNPECKRNAGGWTLTSADGSVAPANLSMGGGGANANCAESYHSSNGFDMSQTLEGLKPGVYRLDGHAFYRNDNDNTGTFPYFYVNDQQSRFRELTGGENNMNSAYLSFLNGNYAIEPIYFNVAEGESVKIGVHGENTAFWNIWGELGLTYYGADASIAEIKASASYADYNKIAGKPMGADILAAMEAAKTAYEADPSDGNLTTFAASVVAAVASVEAYANNKLAIDAMFALMESTNVYTVEAYEAYKATAEDFLVQYEAGTLTATVDNPAAVHGWHAEVAYDDMLLSAFGVKDFDTNLYINTWSTEGETDDSEFKVPFFEYWVNGDNAEILPAATKTATMTGLKPGQYYAVEAWVRVQSTKDVAAADANGVTLSVGDGEAIDITNGAVINSDKRLSHAVYTAYGYADAEGNLTINFNVLEGNNVSWLSFKNLKYAEVPVVESITLNKTWGELYEIGATLQLEATVAPEEALDKTITWSSSADFVTVDENGLVTVAAAGQGQVEIKATAANGVSASCWLMVEAFNPGEVQWIQLNKTWGELSGLGASLQLEVTTIEPADATETDIAWSSSSEAVEVDETGLVTVVAPYDGSVTITATAKSGVTATCMLTVTAMEVTLNATWGELNEVGATLQLEATVVPEDAWDKSVTWTSSHPEIVTVDETGLVTVVKAGMEMVEVKATASDGSSASCWLTVYVIEPGAVTGITLNATWKDLEVKSGDTFQLVATVLPEDATDKTITWSSNADFATVDENGLVTFTGTPEDGGAVTITATASNGVSATCMISVTFVDEGDGIDSINADSKTVIYDIHGRRVEKMTKGVYIVNGKKVVIK